MFHMVHNVLFWWPAVHRHIKQCHHHYFLYTQVCLRYSWYSTIKIHKNINVKVRKITSISWFQFIITFSINFYILSQCKLFGHQVHKPFSHGHDNLMFILSDLTSSDELISNRYWLRVLITLHVNRLQLWNHKTQTCCWDQGSPLTTMILQLEVTVVELIMIHEGCDQHREYTLHTPQFIRSALLPQSDIPGL